jgi:hypothetical protein
MTDIRTHLVVTEYRLADVRREQEGAARRVFTLQALKLERPPRQAAHVFRAGPVRFLRALRA